jgi:isocitrate dehydrogenase (NAD+)
MAAHRVTLIPGDGIGPEVTTAARLVLDATGVAIEWDVQPAGHDALARAGTPLPDALVASISERGVALKGPVATPVDGGFRSVNVALRDALRLHTGIRPARTLPGAPVAFAGVDVVVARMLGGDLYAGIEYAAGTAPAAGIRRLVAEVSGERIAADAGISLKPISAAAAEAAARATMAWAQAAGRERVTVVHKASVMRATDGLFLERAREVARSEFPALELEERAVDSVCHDLVARPPRPDVLLTTMLYGDLLSDLCAGLTGGLGLAPGANLGDGCAVFEPVHGTAPRLAGADRANPLAMIRSGAMLLRRLGEDAAAEGVEDAVAGVVAEGRCVTYDLRSDRDPGRAAGTAAVAEAVAARLAG